MAPLAGIEHLELLLGNTGEVEGAEEQIGVHLTVAEHLGEPSGADVTPEVHLPEPILGMDVALGEEEVVLVARIDMGNAVVISNDLDITGQTGSGYFAIDLGEGASDQEEAEDGDDGGQHEQADQYPPDPSHARSLCPESSIGRAADLAFRRCAPGWRF